MQQFRPISKLRMIVGGFIGLLPAGGVTWDYVQYPVGFKSLGHDVFYIEDTRLWPVYQNNDANSPKSDSNVAYLEKVMNAFGLSDHWAYRDEISGKYFGLSEERVREVCRTADVFMNISCSTYMRDEYLEIPVRILIDSDPMFTQIQYMTQATGTKTKTGIRRMVDAHTHQFTFGENFKATDCLIPDCGINWIPTRQPICLSLWPFRSLPDFQNASYTTVMNWSAARPLNYNGKKWGQKNVEFERFIELPKAVPNISFAVAVGQTTGSPFPKIHAKQNGWQPLDPSKYASDWKTYRKFIQRSRGEFSVAKETYVKARTGWFSCRSACYLASGRPVIAQDTGWSRHIPNGEGLQAFTDIEGAIDALKRVEKDYSWHCKAARTIAEEYFDSKSVLNNILNQIN